MLFTSHFFLFIFLPVVLIIYFILNRNRLLLGSKIWLVFASLFFYGWWDVRYLSLISVSIIFNYITSHLIISMTREKRAGSIIKTVFIIGIIGNLSLLAYFKYSDFFFGTINQTVGTSFPLLNIALPLGISFFTITQIAYLVDTYEGLVKEDNFLNYALFVTFFPHLLAGPIIHHKEMMPQFDSIKNKIISYRNLSIGLFLFSIGLFKKTVIADTFSSYVKAGFDTANMLSFIEAWITSASYTFQIYFDFSGYTDMALGVALMFNIKLPINFNSPYKAVNIQDFWRRWHITLSRFLKDYIYVRLGGNRLGDLITYRNLLLTFLIGGLWHGAAWTFVFWGFLHGIAILIHRAWSKTGIKMYKILAWFITFNFVNITWVFFRANEWNDALRILKGMAGLDSTSISARFETVIILLEKYSLRLARYAAFPDLKNFAIMSVCSGLILFFAKNSIWYQQNFRFNNYFKLSTIFLFLYGVLSTSKFSEFLYFQF